MLKIRLLLQKICRLSYYLGASSPIKRGKGTIIMGSSFLSKDTTVGDYSYIGYNCFITKAKIGRYVSIANTVLIGQGEHDLTRVSNSSFFYADSYNTLTHKECVIQSDVWIGAGSIIRRGVTIGTGAVIGANSFVNKDIPPFAIVVGSPARILKYKFTEKKIELILKSQWWERDLAESCDLLNELENTL